MAQKKNGCGFLIIALVLLVVGGIIATILGMGAAKTGKEFVENIESGKIFAAPDTLEYTSDVDEEVTVWLTSDTAPTTNSIEIEVTDKDTGESTIAVKPSGTSTMGNQHLIATFSVKKGQNYSVKANGASDGQSFVVAGVDSEAVLSMLGKGFGAIGAFGFCAFLALIFGIIGLIKFFSSKKEVPSPPAQ